MHLKIFTGHKPPSFAIWPDYIYASNNNLFKLPDDSFLNGITDKIISEYYSLFLIKKYLVDVGIIDGQITICQHRRFVLNSKIGAAALNQPFARVVSNNEAAALTGDLLEPLKGNILLASPYFFKGTLIFQYGLHHPVRDLLRFTSDCIDFGLLSADDVHKFLISNNFMPAPSCGTYPIEIFIEVMDLLQKCTLAFHKSGYVERSGYQGRAISFLLERLNSYLLIRALKSRGYEFSNYCGFTTLANEGNVILGG